MAHNEWKESETYFSPYKNNNNSNLLNGVERIDLNSPVIIIPIICENSKCIIIWHRYLPATEKESSTNNEIKKKHHHDFYCIYSHQQSNTHIKEFEEHYQNTELCKENDCTSIKWKDIHIEEETQCLSTSLYALMTNLLGIIDSV